MFNIAWMRVLKRPWNCGTDALNLPIARIESSVTMIPILAVSQLENEGGPKDVIL